VKIGFAVGNAKVVLPSPPYLVPSKENKAVFWEIDINWPFIGAQPVGQKSCALVMV
jgi:hypothetical protein